MRDRAEILRIHRRATNLFDRYGRRCRDGIDHDAFERTLPQLADQQADQEFLLVGRGARKQGLQCLGTLGRGARTAQGGDVRKARIDIADRQRRRRCDPALLAGLAQDRVADAETTLRDFAR